MGEGASLDILHPERKMLESSTKFFLLKNCGKFQETEHSPKQAKESVLIPSL